MKSIEQQFREEVSGNVDALGRDVELKATTQRWINQSAQHRYTYNFSWLGRPIIQYPQDIVAIQELIWTVQPELIIETGIAHGGSLLLSASMLEINSACGGPAAASVVGVDIDIREHNRVAIESHPLSRRIIMIEGSSTDPNVVSNVCELAAGKSRVLVFLDSNHTHEHVLAELIAYAPLTSVGSWCVVFDSVIEDMPSDAFPNRPWGRGNNPKTAVREYLGTHKEFEIDRHIETRLLITCAPDGFLKRVR